MSDPIVIVGAGQAGGRTAQALRAQGWDGPLLLVGDEPAAPYERPPLSKGLLTGAQSPAQCALRPDADWSADRIERIQGLARGLDVAGRTLTLADGRSLRFAALVLATGGRARPLALPGAELDGVCTLRTLADAAVLAPRLRPGARIVVIGGGFIGLEVAASARERGCTVTVVEAGPRLLGRAVPADVAQQVADLHRAHGVELCIGQAPSGIVRAADGTLQLRLGERLIAADSLVVGIGIAPDVALARSGGLAVRDEAPGGVIVDAGLRASAGPVWALGDVALFPSPLNGWPQRQETWHNAETQAPVVAHNVLAALRGAAAQDWVGLPWFWSDQYDHQLQVAGEPALGVREALRPLDASGAAIRFHFGADGRLVGAAGYGPASLMGREMKLARMLVERRAAPEAAALADPAHKLKALLAAA
ncbi:NAD(P)/FAD-dependent oxidoreductase [Pseudaquabacterium rugosum]